MDLLQEPAPGIGKGGPQGGVPLDNQVHRLLERRHIEPGPHPGGKEDVVGRVSGVSLCSCPEPSLPG